MPKFQDRDQRESQTARTRSVVVGRPQSNFSRTEETTRKFRSASRNGNGHGPNDAGNRKKEIWTREKRLNSFKQALEVPFATISKKIICADLLPLFPVVSSSDFPVSMSYYEEASQTILNHGTGHQMLTNYICFKVPDETFSKIANCVGIARHSIDDSCNLGNGHTSFEAVLLRLPDGYLCVDLSLYKEGQIVLLLNEVGTSSGSSENACMIIVQVADLPFVSISKSAVLKSWRLHELQDCVMQLQLENEKVRGISHSVVAPLAVSASRGVACVFAARKRALVYILEEDEDEILDSE